MSGDDSDSDSLPDVVFSSQHTQARSPQSIQVPTAIDLLAPSQPSQPTQPSQGTDTSDTDESESDPDTPESVAAWYIKSYPDTLSLHTLSFTGKWPCFKVPKSAWAAYTLTIDVEDAVADKLQLVHYITTKTKPEYVLVKANKLSTFDPSFTSASMKRKRHWSEYMRVGVEIHRQLTERRRAAEEKLAAEEAEAKLEATLLPTVVIEKLHGTAVNDAGLMGNEAKIALRVGDAVMAYHPSLKQYLGPMKITRIHADITADTDDAEMPILTQSSKVMKLDAEIAGYIPLFDYDLGIPGIVRPSTVASTANRTSSVSPSPERGRRRQKTGKSKEDNTPAAEEEPPAPKPPGKRGRNQKVDTHTSPPEASGTASDASPHKPSPQQRKSKEAHVEPAKSSPANAQPPSTAASPSKTATHRRSKDSEPIEARTSPDHPSKGKHEESKGTREAGEKAVLETPAKQGRSRNSKVTETTPDHPAAQDESKDAGEETNPHKEAKHRKSKVAEPAEAQSEPPKSSPDRSASTRLEAAATAQPAKQGRSRNSKVTETTPDHPAAQDESKDDDEEPTPPKEAKHRKSKVAEPAEAQSEPPKSSPDRSASTRLEAAATAKPAKQGRNHKSKAAESTEALTSPQAMQDESKDAGEETNPHKEAKHRKNKVAEPAEAQSEPPKSSPDRSASGSLELAATAKPAKQGRHHKSKAAESTEALTSPQAMQDESKDAGEETIVPKHRKSEAPPKAKQQEVEEDHPMELPRSPAKHSRNQTLVDSPSPATKRGRRQEDKPNVPNVFEFNPDDDPHEPVAAPAKKSKRARKQ